MRGQSGLRAPRVQDAEGGCRSGVGARCGGDRVLGEPNRIALGPARQGPHAGGAVADLRRRPDRHAGFRQDRPHRREATDAACTGRYHLAQGGRLTWAARLDADGPHQQPGHYGGRHARDRRCGTVLAPLRHAGQQRRRTRGGDRRRPPAALLRDGEHVPVRRDSGRTRSSPRPASASAACRRACGRSVSSTRIWRPCCAIWRRWCRTAGSTICTSGASTGTSGSSRRTTTGGRPGSDPTPWT